MTYKNGIKEYMLTGVIFGVPMGILFGLMHLSLLLGVITGFLCGFLFALLIFLFVKYQEKKFDKKRAEIAKERKIFCDGAATINGNGGWLFFTEKGLEFYPHKINTSTKEIVIPINTIKRALNAEYTPATPLQIQELRLKEKMCENIELFYKSRHLGEYKKSKVAKIIAENIKYSTDISEEIKNIIKMII